ncbi:hypothetical protein [Thermocoleostomius sinensis]|uniref:Transcription factor RcaD n=1 Tax=Thermocoleostomius sinensis A174 TaxID=2016057 RepID=A0A9E8ZC20_9CYAN|nr:hypothetical protein [Thermocoleostomius sinensis]WAL60388.1 hypothetical protein OXH18_25035 [Thermocoleostomius sinensis A174]
MKAIELKFLLKLLGKSSYRTVISELKPSEKTSASERNKICIDLTNRGIVAHSRRVEKFKLEPSARALLAVDAAESPLTAEQLAVLRACQKQAATPGEIKKVEAGDRQRVIQDLEAKGFIKAEKVQIQEVWLTDRGREYLREECHVSGTATISLNLLQNYMNFLRKELHTASKVAPIESSDSATELNHVHDTTDSFSEVTILKSVESSGAIDAADKPSDAEILHLIQELDRELGTENYLPIFHLRQKLQPPLSREELDQALYRLERNDRIELSSLVEAIRYTPEQIQTGIPQEAGGPLFFIVVNN